MKIAFNALPLQKRILLLQPQNGVFVTIERSLEATETLEIVDQVDVWIFGVKLPKPGSPDRRDSIADDEQTLSSNSRMIQIITLSNQRK